MADAPETLAAPCAAHVPKARVAGFCRANGVRKLSIFGSALRPDFGPESDVDALVEFAPGRAPGLFRMAGMEMELTRMFGRKVDLRTPGDLGRYFRRRVLDEAQAQAQYAREG